MRDPVSLLAVYDAQVRPAETRVLPRDVTAVADGPVVRLFGERQGRVVTLPGTQLAEPAPVIARQRAAFAARREAFEWTIWSHDGSAALAPRLREAGFVAEDPETVLVGLVDDLQSAPAPMPAGVALRTATSGDDLRRIADLESSVWGADHGWLAGHLARRLEGETGASIWVAEAAGDLVSTAWLTWLPGTEFAGLFGGSTLVSWRGRGIYRGLVSARARLAAKHGVRYLHVDASAESRPILERLGFVAITQATPYVLSLIHI